MADVSDVTATDDPNSDNPSFLGLVQSVFLGAQSTLGHIADDVSGVVTHGQDTVGGVAGAVAGGTERVFLGAQETIKDAASPWNLFGLGAGLGAGGILVTGVSVVAGVAVADEFFAGGAGRSALLAMVRRKRSR